MNLTTIVVENTPLRTPKLVTAERGFKAIKDFFEEQSKRNNENNGQQSDDDEAPQDQDKHKSGTKGGFPDSSMMDADEEEGMPEERKFDEYESRKNLLISKEFAYAVIQDMQNKQEINMYDERVIDDYKKKEHEFVSAYDNVIKKYINEDKLNLLPQFFKENLVVEKKKVDRRLQRFGYEKIPEVGRVEE